MSTDTSTTSQKGTHSLETVMVVVDDVLIRMVIADYLRQCGYRIIEAAGIDEAKVVLGNLALRVDVVFTTVELPDARDGFALSHWVREHRPSAQVILAGSLARAADSASELCQLGPHGKKPYETTSIIAEVNQLLASANRTGPHTGL
jgi:DNA-binding NtrC family response regulator